MAYVKFGNCCYYFEPEILDSDSLPSISYDEAKSLLFKTQDIFKEIGIDIYLIFGTLLGAVRDKSFIKGDYDIDVYIKEEKILFNNLEYLDNKGLELIRVIKHKIYTFKYKGSNCYIDIYIFTKRHSIWGLYCYRICDSYIPKKYLRDGDIDFLGRIFKCPKTPENILRFFYYNSWNIPIAHHELKDKKIVYMYSVPSYYYYKTFLRDPLRGFIKKICRKILSDKKYEQIKKIFYGCGA